MVFLSRNNNTGKNPTYAQAKIKLFARNTAYCVKAAFSCFCCLRVELENKEIHHGGFQQQSPQRLVDINEHMDSQNDPRMMRLNSIPVEYYLMR